MGAGLEDGGRESKKRHLCDRCKCRFGIDLRKLPGKDLNLERGNQNPLCCQLHHRVTQAKAEPDNM